MEKGDYDGAEVFYKENLKKCTSLYAKVVNHFNLGKVYLHEGRIEEAKKAFLYVIEHGNKLYVVTLAKEKLASLE